MFILGSSSSSRKEMLKRITSIEPTIISADIDENSRKGELPRKYAIRMAEEKLEKVLEKVKLLPEYSTDRDIVILCADTVCSRGRLILPKGETDEDVKYCMKMLSGRNHDVFTAISAISLKQNRKVIKLSETKVKFKHLSKKDIDEMVKSQSGIGKAGGYTINGFAESFIIKIIGSYSGVTGFPMYEIRNILISFNVL